MEYGVCNLSVIPLRKEPNDTAEMVSQFLFGETFRILQKQHQWLLVKGDEDKYEGWIDFKQAHILTKAKYEKICKQEKYVAIDIVQSVFSKNAHIPILAGSFLPGYDGMSFYLDKEKYIYNGQVVSPDSIRDNKRYLEKCVMKYLHAPYLWGGKSPFGIDCSGFTQIIYRMMGIKLLRDAYQQASQGFDVHFTEAAFGDLAFFTNKQSDKKITHVGILLENNEIIHASGRVRIDKMDHFGIHRPEEKTYSHVLKDIRRVI